MCNASLAVPCRINVKGTSGVGKSTFPAALASRLDLTYIELDALYHGPNWSEPTVEEFRARVRAAMDAAPEGWVIDGKYESKLGDTVKDARSHGGVEEARAPAAQSKIDRARDEERDSPEDQDAASRDRCDVQDHIRSS